MGAPVDPRPAPVRVARFTAQCLTDVAGALVWCVRFLFEDTHREWQRIHAHRR